MKLLICGSRNITDAPYIFSKINKCIEENQFKNITIIEGEARGVDRAAKQWATRYNCPIESYPANWDEYGKAAGYIRNEIMVKACDFCLIIWDGKSNGTRSDIQLCKKYKKPYKLIIKN